MTEVAKVPTVDLLAVADVFVSGLAEVEDIGSGCLRFVFYSIQHTPSGEEERMVVAKLIMPIDALPAAVMQSARACGLSVAMELRNVH